VAFFSRWRPRRRIEGRGRIGLNIRRSTRSRPGVAYVADVAPGLTVAQVAAAALDGVAGAYRQWLTEGFSALAAEFEEHAVLTGRLVTVSDSLGRVIARGRVLGIDADGRLLVEHDGATRAIAAGEVTLRE
jgi:biotin-(acetyl-CoA carboxylase) ligase